MVQQIDRETVMHMMRLHMDWIMQCDDFDRMTNEAATEYILSKWQTTD